MFKYRFWKFMLFRATIRSTKAVGRFCHLGLTLALTFGLGACAGLNPLPGGALTGCEEITESFAFAQTATLLRLETRGDAPYSVWLRVTLIEGRLFVDAAPRRKWLETLKRNPNVRLRIADKIYPAFAVRTNKPRFTQPFLSGRLIYEMLPRDEASGLSPRCSRL
jgi:hypothetical protein